MAWSALRKRLKGHEGSRSERGRRPRLGVEAMEDRSVPAVDAFMNGTTLNITLDAADLAEVIGDAATAGIRVTGGGFSEDFTGVHSINVTGNGHAGQTVALFGEASLTGNLSIDRVVDVTLTANANYAVGGNVIITTAGQGSAIGGHGTFTVTGATRLSTSGQVRLGVGGHDFQGPVRLSAGGTVVSLKDVNTLRLAALSVPEGATLTAGAFNLTGSSGAYTSGKKGDLALLAAGPTQAMAIGGPAGGYLSQNDINKLGTGFGRVVIGDVAQNNPINVLAMHYHTTTAIRTGNVLAVNGAIQSGSPNANLELNAAGGVTLNANILAGGGDVSISGPVTLGTPEDVQIRTAKASPSSRGAISLGEVNDDATPTVLHITAAGDVTFRGDDGALRPVKGVEIATADDVTFAGSTNAGYIKQERGTGETTLHDVVVSGSDKAIAIDITTSRVSLLGHVTAAGQTVRFNVSEGIKEEGATGLTAAALALKGKGEFVLEGFANDIATLAADIEGPRLSFRDLNDLTVGTVGPVKGITTSKRVNVALDVGGQLVIGSGAGEDIRTATHLVGNRTLTLKAGGVVLEKAGSSIAANQLILQGTGAGDFDLSGAGNQVSNLIATIHGDLDFRTQRHLTIGRPAASPDEVGISTDNGDVRIWTDVGLTVKAAVNTQPGGGGEFNIDGNESLVQLQARIVLGKGNVTFFVPGKQGR